MELNVTMIASERDKISISFIAKHGGETKSAEIVLINKGLFTDEEFANLKKFVATVIRVLGDIISNVMKAFTAPMTEGEEKKEEEG